MPVNQTANSINGKPKKFLFFFTIILTIFILNIPVQIHAKNTDVIYEMSLDDLLNLKVSVASKSEQSIGDAPSSVTVITRDEMLNMGVKNVEELLNYIPGFVVEKDVTSYRKEHVSVRGGRFYDVLFLYNGHRMNGSYQSAYSNGTQYIPVENIKQIEIIRGPGSALYGSNAFLGVVNIVTADDINNIYMAAGDLERKEAAINISKQEGDLLIAGFVKGFSDLGFKYGEVTDSWGQKEYTRDPINGFNASFTIKYKDFTLDARHNEVQIEDFLMFGNLGTGINNGKLSQSHINLRYMYKMNDRLEFDFSGGLMYDHWDAVFTQIPADFYPVATDDDGIPTQFNSQILAGGPYLKTCNATTNIDARYKISDTNNLITGISLEYAKTIECSNQGYWNYGFGNDFKYLGMLNKDIDGQEFNLEENRKVFGLYVQDQQQIGESLTLTAGIRFDDYSDFGNSLNPRAALVYSTPFDSKIKLMYGEAFRAPNFSELYDKNNPSFAGNDDLNAEKVKTFEIAYYQNLNFLQSSITYFNAKVSDRIDGIERIDPNDQNSPLVYDNLGDRTTKGLELHLKAFPMKNILVSLTYLHFLSPDKEVLRVPANSGSFTVNYHIGRINWNVSSLYRESHKLVPNQDDYFLFNTALYVNLIENLRLKAVINNIGDEEYYTYSEVLTQEATANVILDKEGLINRGRTFTIGIECPF